jgi:hypothetical protein
MKWHAVCHEEKKKLCLLLFHIFHTMHLVTLTSWARFQWAQDSRALTKIAKMTGLQGGDKEINDPCIRKSAHPVLKSKQMRKTGPPCELNFVQEE